ncbi:DNA polymerase III subunit theta [Rahnella sp. PD12R]|uniref:DNA polymerase III subunit theta n=1 Tax=Rahnella sp. PD12R TaxID=2855688 RepID=UPI001C44B68F|nr:DNA polymerase III subunit theta [Rahnella sp. PD12R]MBV6817565.1 DNA polymerase III subunit theta [Rahnella sp. PD12R]
MSYNLADLPKDEMDKINVDLAAGGVAFKERYNQPVVAEIIEREQPEHLREYFRERLAHHREMKATLGKMDIQPKEERK